MSNVSIYVPNLWHRITLSSSSLLTMFILLQNKYWDIKVELSVHFKVVQGIAKLKTCHYFHLVS